jgi:hypothetical protein
MISIPIGEYFGRSKHIGKWWTVTLITCGIIPGIIALMFSPKASSLPTKGIGYKIAGFVFIFLFGLIGIVLAFASFIYTSNLNETTPIYVTQHLGIQLMLGIWSIIIGYYLTDLGSGKVVNKNPKDYLFLGNMNWFKNLKDDKTSSVSSFKLDSKYYIVKENKPYGPFTIKELEVMQIREDDLVCLNGSKEWSKASMISVLEHIVIFNPPPVPIKEEIKEDVKKEIRELSIEPPIPTKSIKFEKVFDQNELEIFLNGLTVSIGDKVFDGGVLAEGHYILPNGVEIDCQAGIIVNYSYKGIF